MRKNASPDTELTARLRAGDESSFSYLVKRLHPQMVRLARIFVSSDAVAEEVAQETWLAVLSGLNRFEGRSSLQTWVFRILTNRAKTRGVKEGRSVPFSSMGDASDPIPAVEPERFTKKGSWAEPPRAWSGSQPEETALNKEARKVIEEAVADLPANQATVITMRDIQEFSSEEVCEMLGVSDANQRVLLHRARSRLRTVLGKYLEGEAVTQPC